MNQLDTDVVIIGAGTAGLNARRAVEGQGKRWIMLESGHYGTTCARVGCMPSKLLIAAADAVHHAQHADVFGVRIARSAIVVDGPAVMQRVQRERDRFVGFITDANARLDPERSLRGHARFVGPTTLEVDDHTRITTRATVIATGSTPIVPIELQALLGDRVLTNDHVFELADVPRSVCVIGTGVIGLELGQALHRLGARVVFLSRKGSLSGLTDPDVRHKAHDILAAELDMRCDVKLVGATRTEGGVRVDWECDGNPQSDTFEYVLAATGRRPNLGALGLETTGLACDAKGTPLHDMQTMQCGELPIFIAGDVGVHRAVLHEAADEGRIAGHNAALWPDVAHHARRAALAVTFTDPNIAMVGMRFADLTPEHVIGEVSFDDQGRSRVMAKNAGLMRLYAHKPDRRLVGAEMVGPRMEHLAHLIAWSVQSGLTVDDCLAMPFYHPVVEEGLRTGLQDLRKHLA